MRTLAIIIALFAPTAVQSLWPIPRSLTTGSTTLKVSTSFDITVNVASPPQDLLDAVSRTKSSVLNEKMQVRGFGMIEDDRTAY